MPRRGFRTRYAVVAFKGRNDELRVDRVFAVYDREAEAESAAISAALDHPQSHVGVAPVLIEDAKYAH